MKFAATVLSVGIAGMILASNLESPASAANDTLVAAMRPSSEMTGSISADASPPTVAVRLIDLRSGATCKISEPTAAIAAFKRVPMGPECAKSPDLARVAYWRSTEEGSLIMAGRDGKTILEFVRGDGVLYESIYPSNALITIVPARG